MSVAELDAQAQALRAEGLVYREIGERMGETTKQAWRRCNREYERAAVRAYKVNTREERRAYDRAYADRHRATCPHCGHVYKSGSGTKRGLRARVNFAQCPGCREHRREWIVGMWDQGATIAEIAEPLGWTEKHVGVEMNRMRKLGYPLPYRYKLKGPRMTVPDRICVELTPTEAEWLTRLTDFLADDDGAIPSGLRKIRAAYTAATPEAQEEPSWWRGEPVYDLDGRDVSACDYCRAIQTRDWQAADYAACTCGRRA